MKPREKIKLRNKKGTKGWREIENKQIEPYKLMERRLKRRNQR